MKYDALIIGAGLGGLTAGAKMAKEGRKILVIEQHNIVGGCATSFKRGAFTIEVGLHEMDGLHDGDLKNEIFQELEVFEHVDFIKVPEFYRFINGKFDIVIPHSFQGAADVLIKNFPEEKQGIKKLFKIMEKIYKEISLMPQPGERLKATLLLPVFPLIFPNLIFRQKQTIGNLVRSIVSNDDLTMCFFANAGYYHDDPYTLSLLAYSAAQGSYFSGGGHYIKGGSQRLSNHLAEVILKYGGEIVLSHQVTGIITKNQKAIGLKYKKRKALQAEEKTDFAETIIANAAIPHVINDLLPSNILHKFRKKVSTQKIAHSLLSVHICFKKTPKELGNRHYNTVVFDSDINNFSNLDNFDCAGKVFAFVDYSQIDSCLAPEGKSVGSICVIDYLSNWEDLSPEEYKAKKESTAQTLIEKLDNLIPGTKEGIEYYEVATPKTIVRYTGNTRGSVFGFAQIPSQSGINRINYKSPLKNLYFASAWTRPGGGFTGAIVSGYNCAQEILNY